jgi:hypothetical protein
MRDRAGRLLRHRDEQLDARRRSKLAARRHRPTRRIGETRLDLGLILGR